MRASRTLHLEELAADGKPVPEHSGRGAYLACKTAVASTKPCLRESPFVSLAKRNRVRVAYGSQAKGGPLGPPLKVPANKKWS
jgi:hypothetical protein